MATAMQKYLNPQDLKIDHLKYYLAPHDQSLLGHLSSLIDDFCKY